MATTTLHQQEAVLLAHALVARLADDTGARILFIKGPTAVAVGARPDRSSTDVDVLVDPATFHLVCGALETAGWRNRSASGFRLSHVGDVSFVHSEHYIHADWPCDLDIHYNFAGFLQPADEVFDALWARRADVEIANQRVPAPDLIGQSLVVALHALRDPDKQTSKADLEHLKEVLAALDKESVAALVRLSAITGSEFTAGPFLSAADGLPTESADGQLARSAAAWAFHQQAARTPGVMWMTELVRSPWRERPALLRRAILPPRELLLNSVAAPVADRRTIARLHVARWLRGLRALPEAMAWTRKRPK